MTFPRAKSGISTPTSKPFPTPKSATPSSTLRIRRPNLYGLRRDQAHGIRRAVSGGIARAYSTARRFGKLRLNDSAFTFEPENSVALGFGFRCGLLGLLHLEIVQERLEREFNIDLITTRPACVPDYPNRWRSDRGRESDQFPDPSLIHQIDEPIIDATVITREEYLGGVLALLEEKRGVQKKFEYIGSGRVMLVYELPLNEIVLDFYDRLKSVSRGYASLDYHFPGTGTRPW